GRGGGKEGGEGVERGGVVGTGQNQGFCVAAEDDAAYVSLNDGTCEGFHGDGYDSVQFHPEASPGPLDALPFFDRLAEAAGIGGSFVAGRRKPTSSRTQGGRVPEGTWLTEDAEMRRLAAGQAHNATPDFSR